MKTDETDLTETEKRALRALAEGPEPPASLAVATRRRLSEAGLIGRPGWRTPLLAAVAALFLFALGLAAGLRFGSASAGPAAASPLPRFALFLYDAPDEKDLTDAQMQARVDEYRNWARGVRAAGLEIAGEKLEPEGRVLGPPASSPAWALGGYFVISAPDMNAAMAVAQSCPHVRHGGRIEVRAIART
ncbi:MAG TPA: YciI family protein [Thermoanaerobaculia bacterium]|jgi:hypothetical protein